MIKKSIYARIRRLHYKSLVVMWMVNRGQSAPDGEPVLVFVESVEDLPLIHSQSNAIELMTLGQLAHLYTVTHTKQLMQI